MALSQMVHTYTNVTQLSNHELVLHVLAKLTFIETVPMEELIIKPLSDKVCNGQAQAMSHMPDDMVPTQSEQPLEYPNPIGDQGALDVKRFDKSTYMFPTYGIRFQWMKNR